MRFCINKNILEYFTQLKYSKAASIKVYIKEVKVKFLIKIFVTTQLIHLICGALS